MKILCVGDAYVTPEMMEKGIISATICQQPFKQGYLPVELLSRYLLEGIAPKEEYNYVDIDIRIRENLW